MCVMEANARKHAVMGLFLMNTDRCLLELLCNKQRCMVIKMHMEQLQGLLTMSRSPYVMWFHSKTPKRERERAAHIVHIGRLVIHIITRTLTLSPAY